MSLGSSEVDDDRLSVPFIDSLKTLMVHPPKCLRSSDGVPALDGCPTQFEAHFSKSFVREPIR